MSKMGMTLEIELGITGGEEDGVDNTDVDTSKLYTQPEEVAYAYEELIAELGSVLFSNHFNITKQMPDNHAKYLNSWIKCLKNDFSFLTGAIAQAQKAFDLFVSTK
jgi:antirestriction protein ArdC